MSAVIELRVDKIKLDPSTQPRTGDAEETISHYRELIEAGVELPPVEVFDDGEYDWLGDGNLRHAAHVRAGRETIKAIKHPGGLPEAQWFSLGANKAHGLPLTKEDKARAIQTALAHPKSAKMSDYALAEHLGVHRNTVMRYRQELSTSTTSASEAPQKRTGRDGREQDTTKIGQRPKPARAAEAPAPEASPTKEPDYEPEDYGRCPNCASTKWTTDDEGTHCAKCHHPHGEPSGGADEDRVGIQRSKTVKTAEALMRAFDDLNTLCANTKHGEAISGCKALLKLAKGWK